MVTMNASWNNNDSNTTSGRISPEIECHCSDLGSSDYSAEYAIFNFVVVIFSMPVVAVLGAIGNFINFYIFSRPKMAVHSANTYLAALAVSDLFVVLSGVIMFWIDSARSYIPEMKRTPYLVVYTLPFGLLAQTCSVYIIVMAAIDCYIKVYWSFKFPLYCTPRRARFILCGVLAVSAVYNSLRFGQFSLRQCVPEEGVTMIEICPTDLYWKVNMIYNVYMYMVLMTLLPFVLLSILNALIVSRVQQQTRRAQLHNLLAETTHVPAKETVTTTAHTLRRHATIIERNSDIEVSGQSTMSVRRPGTPCEPNEAENAASSDDTVTMIMVVLLFLACNVLALVINIVETFFEPDALLLNFMTDLSNLLVMLNSAINFVIYMVFSHDFYDLFCKHILRCFRRPFGQELPDVLLVSGDTKMRQSARRGDGVVRSQFLAPPPYAPAVVASRNGTGVGAGSMFNGRCVHDRSRRIVSSQGEGAPGRRGQKGGPGMLKSASCNGTEMFELSLSFNQLESQPAETLLVSDELDEHSFIPCTRV